MPGAAYSTQSQPAGRRLPVVGLVLSSCASAPSRTILSARVQHRAEKTLSANTSVAAVRKEGLQEVTMLTKLVRLGVSLGDRGRMDASGTCWAWPRSREASFFRKPHKCELQWALVCSCEPGGGPRSTAKSLPGQRHRSHRCAALTAPRRFPSSSTYSGGVFNGC